MRVRHFLKLGCPPRRCHLPPRGEPFTVITVGIDPHKSSLTAVAVDATGHQLASKRLAVNSQTLRHLTTWAGSWPDRRFAVEGAAGLGRGIAQALAGAGEQV